MLSLPHLGGPHRRQRSSSRPNPYSSRGLDKFESVYAELAAKRELLAAQTGAPVSLVRFATGSESTWVPIVISSKKDASASSLRAGDHTSDLHGSAVPTPIPEVAADQSSNSTTSLSFDHPSLKPEGSEKRGMNHKFEKSDLLTFDLVRFRWFSLKDQSWPQIASSAIFVAATAAAVYVGKIAAVGITMSVALTFGVLLRKRHSHKLSKDAVLQEKVEDQHDQKSHPVEAPASQASIANSGSALSQAISGIEHTKILLSPRSTAIPSFLGTAAAIESISTTATPLRQLDSDGGSPVSSPSSPFKGDFPSDGARLSEAHLCNKRKPNILPARQPSSKEFITTTAKHLSNRDQLIANTHITTARHPSSKELITSMSNSSKAGKEAIPAGAGTGAPATRQLMRGATAGAQLPAAARKKVKVGVNGTLMKTLEVVIVLGGLIGGKLAAIILLVSWWYAVPMLRQKLGGGGNKVLMLRRRRGGGGAGGGAGEGEPRPTMNRMSSHTVKVMDAHRRTNSQQTDHKKGVMIHGNVERGGAEIEHVKKRKP